VTAASASKAARPSIDARLNLNLMFFAKTQTSKVDPALTLTKELAPVAGIYPHVLEGVPPAFGRPADHFASKGRQEGTS